MNSVFIDTSYLLALELSNVLITAERAQAWGH
jgi:hypothetical protein